MEKIQKPIQVLFNKPMNRREFLAHLGAGALAVVGIGGIIRMLTDFTTSHHRVSGYGSSPYGGNSLGRK